MASLTDAEAKALTPTINRQAMIVAARYDGVEAEDLAQELWVWLVEDASPALLTYLTADQNGRLVRSVYNAAVKWCERDKKRRLKEAGINWRDQYTYTRPEVARMLPLALDPSTVPGLSGDGLHDGPSAKADPAYGGGMLATLVDIRSAYGRLSESDQRYLTICVALNNEWELIGPNTGQQANSAYAKYMRILDKMVKRLGRVADEGE